MRGAYYVALALLVTASSQIAAELDQAKHQQAQRNGVVTSDGTVDEMLPRRNLRENHDPKDKLRVYAGAEERMFERPPQAFEQAIKAGVMRMDAEAAMARAAEAIKAHEELDPWLMGRTSKRPRIDSTPFNVHGQALQAVPRPRNPMVSEASDVPANRARVKAPTIMMNNAARSAMEHNFLFAPSGPSTSSVTLKNIRPNKQPVAQKTFDFDTIKHLDGVEIRNSRPQHTDPTPTNVGGHALPALRKPEEYKVSVGNDVASLLAKRLKKKKTAIMSNAADTIARHDFRPASRSPSTSGVVSPDIQVNNQLAARKTLDFGLNKHSNELQSHWGGHQLHMRGDNDKFARPEVPNRHSVPEDGKAEDTRGVLLLRNDVDMTEEVYKVHAAFLEAYNLPFHQYPEETAKMLKILKRTKKAGPGYSVPYSAINILINNQEADVLKPLLRPDLGKLLGKELERNEQNLREAYTVKLAIMYELFYDFCYTRPDLFEALPEHTERRRYIVKVLTATGGNSNYPFPLLHEVGHE